ncbi:AAA family ATPase [Deinococcus sp. HMF7620]|uniref:AAA family ATPase n=1 Tax=Deinococcus arboris TaxID=2682977 RepID=A0A7C9M319_9DEIO|nr:polysaccharide biosynthesis tyrosine autokinase [Deinococcus arboris]MVN87982.1 AAA family ATPase [Deinococcus arboris]
MNNKESQIREIDISFLWRALKRNLIWVLAIPALLALASFAFSRQQAATYESAATLIASNTSTTPDTVAGQATVSAPPLPEGVLAQALQSEQILFPVLRLLEQDDTIPAEERARLVQGIRREIQDQKLRTLSLTSRLDFSGNGTYTVSSRARTPEAAQALANLTSEALVDWDRGRGLTTIRRGLQGFDAQLDEITTQLNGGALSVAERQTLSTRRARIQDSRVQLAILENSAVGVLAPLVTAQTPRLPVSPKPLRNAVLAGLVGLLLSVAGAGLVSVSDRTVRTEEDLLPLGLPTLATLPRMRQRDVLLRGIVRAARQAGLYEAVGFLKVNLMAALANRPQPVIMITSTAPGEGKSSVTATLADGMAASGQRVLIVDADLRRGTQAAVWKKYDETGAWKVLGSSGGIRTTQEGLLRPHEVEVLQVEPNLDVLPAGPGTANSLSVFNQADIAQALALWRQYYDVVLIDTAPLLALADGLVLGPYTDAVIMVVEYGQTNVHGAANALRRAERAGLKVIGSVINKANLREESTYNYSYSYSPAERA